MKMMFLLKMPENTLQDFEVLNVGKYLIAVIGNKRYRIKREYFPANHYVRYSILINGVRYTIH